MPIKARRTNIIPLGREKYTPAKAELKVRQSVGVVKKAERVLEVVTQVEQKPLGREFKCEVESYQKSQMKFTTKEQIIKMLFI